jgi:dipeptidyl aminopeptidase/acylaminoacyl peptidase
MTTPQTEAPPRPAAAAVDPNRAALRTMQIEDLLRFVWAADPQISPDGTRIAFTRVHIDAEADEYRSALWVIASDGGAARPLTFGPYDAQPRWSPDGRTIAFTRRKDQKGKPQLWLLPMDGGEARERTALTRGVAEPAWSPDGKRIAFVSSTNPRLDDAKKEEPKNAPARVVTRPEWRMNG